MWTIPYVKRILENVKKVDTGRMEKGVENVEMEMEKNRNHSCEM